MRVWKFFYDDYIEFIVLPKGVVSTPQYLLTVKYYKHNIPPNVPNAVFRKGECSVSKTRYTLESWSSVGWLFPPENSSLLDLLVVTGLNIKNIQWYWSRLIDTSSLGIEE